jgi:hypothetical protein
MWLHCVNCHHALLHRLADHTMPMPRNASGSHMQAKVIMHNATVLKAVESTAAVHVRAAECCKGVEQTE